MARRRQGLAINGWLIIDKPSGPTSTAVCNAIRRLTGGAKAGHGGTLDPLATGVLPIALGEATKTVPYVMDGRKAYRFTLRWGDARDTDDAEGEITKTSPARPDRAAVEAALPAFIGRIEQQPPRYSAIKIAGKRAYALAREGAEAVEIPVREVDIFAFRLIEMADADHATFEVESGKGVYMRSLARDLAAAVGTCGHITVLRRLSVGPFRQEDAIPLADLQAIGHIDRETKELLPVETALADIPALAVTGDEAADLRRGQVIRLFRRSDLERLSGLVDGSTIRAQADGRLVALARYACGEVHPIRVMKP